MRNIGLRCEKKCAQIFLFSWGTFVLQYYRTKYYKSRHHRPPHLTLNSAMVAKYPWREEMNPAPEGERKRNKNPLKGIPFIVIILVIPAPASPSPPPYIRSLSFCSTAVTTGIGFSLEFLFRSVSCSSVWREWEGKKPNQLFSTYDHHLLLSCFWCILLQTTSSLHPLMSAESCYPISFFFYPAPLFSSFLSDACSFLFCGWEN